MLNILDKSMLKQPSSQPLQTNNKQLKKVITFLIGYNGTFNMNKKLMNSFSYQYLEELNTM